jgi:nucleoside-diphosphate-sugar epimerase
MKILVTGAGGFLGQHIVKLLLKEGHEVTNFSRSTYPELDAMGVPTIQGDIRDKEKVIDAFTPFEAVFHVASKVAMWGNWDDFYDINVTGTENVIEACQTHGISKLVYTSTPSVVFGKDDIKGADETQPYPLEHISLYARSKAMAERKVLSANGVKGVYTVSLRPHLIFGPGDKNIIPRLVQAHKENRLKQVGDGRNLVDVLYVENAALAHIQAFNKLDKNSPVAGKAYFLGQERPVILWEFIDKILNIHGLPPVKKKVSGKKAYMVGKVIEAGLGMLKKYDVDPPMTRFVALQLSKSHYFDHKNAFNDFGYHPPIGIEEGLSKLSVTQ